MDTTQWPEQGIGVVKVEGNNNSSGAAAVNNNTKAISSAAAPRPQKPQALNCPRCNSAHTKFCYYNNYSLTQPRYFCKTCRRYWTEGGSLRNVPVGGGSRKNKRSSSSSNPTIAASPSSLSKNIKLPHEIITSNSQNPNSKIIFHDQGQDLNLAYPPTGPSTYNGTDAGISEFVEFPCATSSHHQFSQLLKSGIDGRGSFTSFMSMIPVSDSNNNNSAAIYSSPSGGAGLPFQEFSKPITSGVNFSLDQQHGFESSGGGGVYGSLQLGVHQESSGSNNHAKLFNFPFEVLKQQPVLNSSTTSTQDPALMDQQSRGTTVTTTNTTQGDHHHHHHHHHHHQSPAGYWNNINGGGSW